MLIDTLIGKSRIFKDAYRISASIYILYNTTINDYLFIYSFEASGKPPRFLTKIYSISCEWGQSSDFNFNV